MKNTLTKRMFGVGLSAVMLLSSVSVASADNYGISTYGTVYHADQKFDIANASCREAILKCNGSADYDNFAPAQVSWTNPATNAPYQAYCINPAYPGYGDVADYGIDIERFDNSCIVDAGGSGGSGKTAGSASSAGNTIAAFLEGAVNYGYPSVSAETLLGGSAAEYGVSQNQLEYAAYLATKMAIWSGIHDNYGINTWSENTGATQYPHALRVKVLAATKSIYKAAGSYTPHDGLSTVTLTAGTPTLSGSNYETTFTIANTDNNVDGSDMYVEMLAGGQFMDGLTICDMNGKEYPTTTGFNDSERYILPDGTTEFKAILPDPGDAGATVELRLYAQQKAKILLYGRSTSVGAQNYVLAGNFYDNPYASFVIGDTGIVEDPDEPVTPSTPSGSGDLTVIKLDARDNATPLPGVTFDCYNAKGQLIDTGTTDSNGKWIPEISGPGTYTIIERDSGKSYQLTEPTSLVITVQDGEKATATFRDYPSQTVTMEKEDAATGKPIPGVEYEIMQIDGDGAWRATGKTDSNGKITWEDVPDGTYLVREVSTVEGYILDSTPQYVTVKNGQAPSLKFLNSKFPGLTIMKVDDETGDVIEAPTIFKVEQINGSYTTTVQTENGIVTLKDLPVGSYKISEQSSPEGYVLDDTPETIYLGENESKQVIIRNLKAPVLTIEKDDDLTNDPVPGTKFEVKKADGTKIGVVETGKDGKVTVGMKGSELGYLEPGTYTVTEISVPEPYILSGEHQDIQLKAGDEKSLLFENIKKPTLVLQKTDATTNKGIPNTTFKIEYEQADGSIKMVGTYRTDADGRITLPYVEPGWYIATETIPAQGMQMPTNPVTRIYLAPGDNSYLDTGNVTDTTTNTGNTSSNSEVKITSGKDYPVVGGIVNYPLNSIVIKKADVNNGAMLSGGTFEVIRVTGETSGQNGTVVCTVTTDASGVVVVTGLEAGAYAVREIKAPENYLIAETNLQTVNLKADGTSVVEVIFRNIPYGSLLIVKSDDATDAPIPGTKFKVTTSDGTVVGNENGIFTTGQNGEVLISGLKPGSYVVSELEASDGYAKDDTPKTVKIGTDGGTYRLEFTNKALSGIKIMKTDSESKSPLPGIEFLIAKLNGEKIGTFTTDENGMIFVGDLEEGWYTVTETKGLEGYHWDEEPRTVEVKAEEPTVVKVENKPYSCLVIEKTNSRNDKPIPGTEFLVTKLNGEEIGYYETDESGMIVIEGLEEGTYLVKETKAADGFLLDSKAREVQIKDGKRETLPIKNDPLASILIHKVDSVTGEGIYGVPFILYDADNNPIGQFETDDEGYIYIEDELPAGKYKLRELEPAEGYLADNKVRTITVQKGRTTEVEWENTPQMGQIQITKKSSDDNPYNGFPAGTALPNAEFEIYDRSNNLVDTVVTNKNGIAISKTLPLGRYTLKESKAPDFYGANTQDIQAEIEYVGQIVRLEVYNSSLYTNVAVNKKGYTQVAPNQSIRYEFTGIKNNSTVSLNSFYWRDTLPVEAVRLDKIITGTWNQRLSYKIVYKTNLHDYRTLADNLDTSKNNVILASPTALGLPSNEYVTEIMFVFGTVKSGFAQVETPYIYCNVLPTVTHEQRFTNSTDVGGLHQGQWIMSNDRWVTVVYGKQEVQKLPRTGY
ncbi:SpaA isopeptide-forming pilin-related protein [Anaerotignum sp.]|nr:SpaA isopeptide-forming pilin-related protein [Anaerotignum sp.]MBQ7757495.1 Cys-Gln thioester bond-forming surface protein [Anaerotignum sp.]